MSVASASTLNADSSDSWGSPAATSVHARIPPSSSAVRDDWDDDDDGDGEEDRDQDQDPQKLWEEANQRAPMPQVVIASSSTSGAAALSPPPAALQPALRILKRPSTSSAASSSGGPSSPGLSSSSPAPTDASRSYAEREARYQAARERIFGEGADGAASSGDRPVSVQIAREPRGPPARPAAGDEGAASPARREEGGDARGFTDRRGKRKGGGKPSS